MSYKSTSLTSKSTKAKKKAPLSRKDENSLFPIAFWGIQVAMEEAAGTSAKDDALVDTPDALLDQPFEEMDEEMDEESEAPSANGLLGQLGDLGDLSIDDLLAPWPNA